MYKFFNPRRDFANVAKAQQARAQANRQAWKEIPLRDFIRDDPAMQTLEPLLKMRLQIEDTRDYARTRAIIGKAIHNDIGDAGKAEKQLASTMKHIANQLEENTVSVSRKNHIPGFRQIVFMNPDIIPDVFDNNSRMVRVAAVTDDGRLVMTILKGVESVEKLQSTAEMLEVFLVGRTGWKIMPASEDHDPDQLFGFDLDKHSGNTNTAYDHNNLHLKSRQCPTDMGIFHETDIHGAILKILLEHANHNSNLARMTLCNALDPDVIHNMRTSQITNLDQVRWLTGGDGADPTKIQARQQAVRAYPILASKFSKFDLYCNIIDARESLSKTIAAAYKVPQPNVRNIQGLSRQWAACNSDKDASLKAGYILSLPEHLVPRTRKQIRHLSALDDFGFMLFGEISDARNPPDRRFLKEIMVRLSAEGHLWQIAGRIDKYCPFDVEDAIDFLTDKLFVPAALNGIRKNGGEISKDCDLDTHQKILAISSFKIRNLLDFSDRYHRNIHRWEDRLTSIFLEQDWPGLMGTIELEDGHVARELCSSKDLKTQGRVENHCVGGYMSRILDGNTCGEPVALIFSIEKNGTILSTAEINCAESDNGLQAWVERNEGYENASSSDIASIMADQIVSKIIRINPDSWHAYLDGLECARDELDQMPGVDQYSKACGFDPYDRNMLERVWKEFSPVLPQAMRRAGLDAFIDWVGEELKQDPSQSMHDSNLDVQFDP